MQWMNELGRRVSMLLRRDEFDRDLDEEMRLHIQLRAQEQAGRGISAEDARAAARRQFGNATLLREQSRDAWGWRWLDQLVQDVRYGVRNLLRTPGFTAIAVLTLAVGIGATTTIFSAVNPILFEPLPYPDAGRIMMIWETRSDRPRNNGSFGMYRGLVERDRSFDAIAVLKPWQPTMTGEYQPERFDGQRVSASYFQVLGVSPILGRDFQPSDDRLNGPNVVILSDSLWRRRLAADPTIVGRQITLDESAGFAASNSYTVIGVMPGGFENVLAPSAELWAPLQYDLSQGRAWGHHLRTVGRLRLGVSVDQATRDLNVLGESVLKEQHPVTYGGDVQFSINSLQEDVTRGVKPALLAILGAVILVLLIACVNVTNLLLARGVHRRGEFALRAALGAGHSRLMRQLLTESLLLAAMGGVVGMAVAMLGVRALVALSPPELPRISAIGVDGVVFAFGLGVTTLIGLGFGLIPAVHAARSDPHRDLQHGSRRTAGGHRRMRSSLVVAEVALALVLLVASGLLLRTLEHLFGVSPGFTPSHLLTMQVEEIGHRFDADATRYTFFEQALEAVRHVPGVTAAALTSQLPLSGDFDIYGVNFEHDNNPEADHGVFRYAVTPGYFETIGIPLQRGRLLDEHDRAGAPLVALINESFAKRAFPGQDAIGQRIHVGPTDKWYSIVGVVGDVKQMSLAVSQSDAVYITTTQWHWADTVMSLVVGARDDAAALAPDVRQAVWSVDKDQPVVRVATMDSLLAASAAERRFALIVFEAFALAALVLAAAGIYGVLSGSVAERTREIGVRLALGAPRGSILALVVRQGMILTGLGVAIGLAGAVTASQAIAAMLFGVSRLDAVTYIGVIALLAGVSAIACGVPAWRAVRVDPAITLRAE
jgi:putative ABC transport system permease protein